MTPILQEWIHRLEVGAGARWTRALLSALALLALAGLYVLGEYRNLARPDVMDAAQVARQLARGEGFTTLYLRPWSVALLERRALDRPGATNDPGRLLAPHPDLANPPVYPLVMAAAMRLFPISPEIPNPQTFRVYRPDLMIVLLNLGLWIGLLWVVHCLAVRLFDPTVAWLSVLALAGSQLFWNLAGEGQSVVLAAFWVAALAYAVVAYDSAARSREVGVGRLSCLAALAGLLVGLAGLTCYALLGLVVPLLVVLAPGWTGRRWSSWFAALGAFALVAAPWLLRNYQLSGNWFGTASSALLVNTPAFPADALERSLNPTTSVDLLRQTLRNVLAQFGSVLQNDLPRLGGSWVSAFFLTGLVFRFSDPTRNVLRNFALLSLVVLLPARALTRAGQPEVEQDYLAVIAPLIVVLGTAFFCSLLDQVNWPIEGARPLVTALFVLVVSLPLVLLLLPPGRGPLAYPPYHPPLIRRLADWVRPDELIMTDVPWAVAWYADRRAITLTRYALDPEGKEDFSAVNDARQKVAAVYLTQRTTDAKFFSDTQRPRLAREVARVQTQEEGGTWSESGSVSATSWPEFAMRAFVRGPTGGFPLKSAHAAYAVSGQLLLMEQPRWPTGGAAGESDAAEGKEEIQPAATGQGENP